MKKIMFTVLTTILISSLIVPHLEASAYLLSPDGFLVMKKSKGVTTADYGKKTSSKVCGGEICGESKLDFNEKGLKTESIKTIKKIETSNKAAEFMKLYYRLK